MAHIDVRLQGLLMSCNQMSADYLFMQDKLYDIRYDTGDKVIQCGRHNDIFKLWLQWRAKVNPNPPSNPHNKKSCEKKCSPGEARTHNPGIAHDYCLISTVR
jgi:hypothetical protein